MKPVLGLFAALLLAFPAAAHEVQAGDLEIIHPAIPRPPGGASSAAGYMAISNDGHTADRLIGIETAAAKAASLHRSEVSAEGMARILPLDGIEIPAGETIVLEQRAMHVMLMGLTSPLAEGDQAGRAFLRKDDQGWAVELCAGESLLLPATSIAIGPGRADAETLAASVRGAEVSAGGDLMTRLNGFDGTLLIGRAGMADHGRGHERGQGNGN